MKRLGNISNYILFFLAAFCTVCSPKLSGSADGLAVFAFLDLETEDDRLRRVLASNQVGPLDKHESPSAAVLKLGEALFFDKILSGNKNISCATCHNPGLVSGDTLSLSIGEGGTGSGQTRSLNTGVFIHRNSMELHNRSSLEWKSFFWDGRISIDENSNFVSPSGVVLPSSGLKSLLAAQAMIPVLSRTEMLGQSGSNSLANISDSNPQAIWNGLLQRLLDIPEYVNLFQDAYPEIDVSELGFEDASNALGDFTGHLWDTTDSGNWDLSPWNRYLDGDNSALNSKAKSGAFLFYGKAGCSRCHSGSLMTDQKFHNLAIPQFGPGFGVDIPLDKGRKGVSGNANDSFAFRTPSLREVSYTSPYFHNGAYTSLRDVIRHHLRPRDFLLNYDPNNIPTDLRSSYLSSSTVKNEILATLDPLLNVNIVLSEDEMDQLLEFLSALSSPTTLSLGNKIPATVPSGLSVSD
ncbi:cytochrome-c peroxidase [Leptospira koniambonensis]|uniref:cytochrome-c peroxidase n=1 Tax=Leptospira koniambonensis TaxID=2484950 RepID=UPI003EC0780C